MRSREEGVSGMNTPFPTCTEVLPAPSFNPVRLFLLHKAFSRQKPEVATQGRGTVACPESPFLSSPLPQVSR